MNIINCQIVCRVEFTVLIVSDPILMYIVYLMSLIFIVPFKIIITNLCQLSNIYIAVLIHLLQNQPPY